MTVQEAWQVSTDAAELYDRDFVPALFAHWTPPVLDAAEIGPGDRVLDVGCGTGVLARGAAGRGAEVTGIDINEGMLAVAGRHDRRVDWRAGDAGAMPVGTARFDAVISQFALMFLPDRRAALHEMWRALAPGGRLAVLVWAEIEHAPAEAALARILQRRLGDTAAGMLRAPFALGDRAGLVDLAGTAGIDAPAVTTRTDEARFASLDEFVRIEIKASPLAEVVDDAGYKAVHADVRDQLTDFVRGDGSFRFPMSAHILTARKA